MGRDEYLRGVLSREELERAEAYHLSHWGMARKRRPPDDFVRTRPIDPLHPELGSFDDLDDVDRD